MVFGITFDALGRRIIASMTTVKCFRTWYLLAEDNVFQVVKKIEI